MAVQFYVYKSTDNGQTWTLLDDANAPNDIAEATTPVSIDYQAVASYKSGTVIPLLYVSDADGKLAYLEFDTASDTYSTPITAGPGPDIFDLAIQKRVSDGDAIAMYTRDDGVGRPVFYANCDGATWGSEVPVSDGADPADTLLEIDFLQDDTGNVYFIYGIPSASPDSIYYERRLTTGDVLSTETNFTFFGNFDPLFPGVILGDAIYLARNVSSGSVILIPGICYGSPLSNPVWKYGNGNLDPFAYQMRFASNGTNAFIFYTKKTSPDRWTLKYQQFVSFDGPPNLFNFALCTFGAATTMYDTYSLPPNSPPVAPQELSNLSLEWSASRSMWEIGCGLRYPFDTAPGWRRTGFYMDEDSGTTTTTTSSTTTTTTVTFFTTGTTTTNTTTTTTSTTVTFTTGTPPPPDNRIRFRQFTKDPDAILDYTIDWEHVLDEDEDIVTSAWAASDAAITVESDTTVGKKAIAFLSGGVIFTTYVITNTITTTKSRTYNQQFRLRTTRR